MFEVKGLEDRGLNFPGGFFRETDAPRSLLRNSMGNRLSCIFALPLLIAVSLAGQTTQTNQDTSPGYGQDTGCSGVYANDPNCQRNGQYPGGNYGSYGNGGMNSPTMRSPQDEVLYVDSAGQLRSNPNQNYPYQNFP